MAHRIITAALEAGSDLMLCMPCADFSEGSWRGNGTARFQHGECAVCRQSATCVDISDYGWDAKATSPD